MFLPPKKSSYYIFIEVLLESRRADEYDVVGTTGGAILDCLLMVGKLFALEAALVDGGDCDARNFRESFSDGTSFSAPAGGKGRLKQFK